MKVDMVKCPGGVLVPASDLDAETMTSFKTNETYLIEIKRSRNPGFHRKVMAFFAFCMEHWDGSKVHEHCSHAEQFNRFRKDLTILAGFYIQTTRLDGSLRTEAVSISFSNMEEDQFRELYTALINASCKHIFKTTDENTYNQLLSFF